MAISFHEIHTRDWAGTDGLSFFHRPDLNDAAAVTVC
jgi:hypothetical protein